MLGTQTWLRYGKDHAGSGSRGLTCSQANPEYLAVNWEASGGGAFAVIPLNEKGRLPEQIPLFRGHTGPVLDTDWYVRRGGFEVVLTIVGILSTTA